MVAAKASSNHVCSSTHPVLDTDRLKDKAMTITLTGLSKQQYQLAELLWNCDTQAAVDQLKQSLPPRHRREAETVHQLMIAAVMDGYDEVTEDVQALIQALK